MTKPVASKATDKGGSFPSLTSPVKKTRTKGRMIKPTALRKIVHDKTRSLSFQVDKVTPHAMDTRSTTPSVQPIPNPQTNLPAPQPPQKTHTTTQPPQKTQSTTQPPKNTQTTFGKYTETTTLPPTNTKTTSKPPANTKTTHGPTKQQKMQAIREFRLRRSPRKHSTKGPLLQNQPPPKPSSQPADYISTDDGMHTSDMDMTNSQNLRQTRVQEQDSDDSLEELLDGDEVSGGDEGVANEGVAGVDQGVDAGVREDDSLSEQENDGEGECQNGAVETAQGKKRKTRGPTRCLKLVGRRGGRKTRIILNKFGQPIGPNPEVGQLASSNGVLVKKNMVVSLEHKNWRVVPDDVKTEV